MAISSSLEEYLKKREVAYDVVTHRHTLSSGETAEAAHVPGDCLAKSVVLKDDEGYLMAVVPSTHRVDLGRLHNQLDRRVDLATEGKLQELFGDCELGAIPPIGAAYGIPTLMDDSLADEPNIYFEAGDHEVLIHMSGAQFRRLIGDAGHGRFSHHV